MSSKGDPRDSLELNPIDSHSAGEDISSALTLTPPTLATKIMVQALDQNLRFTLDGTTPTASVGFQLLADDPPLLIPLGLNTTIKVIEEAATCDFQYQWGSG